MVNSTRIYHGILKEKKNYGMNKLGKEKGPTG